MPDSYGLIPIAIKGPHKFPHTRSIDAAEPSDRESPGATAAPARPCTTRGSLTPHADESLSVLRQHRMDVFA